MHDNINKLSELLNLTSYQANKLKDHHERYNMSSLQKRGGLLYAPYASRNIFTYIKRIFLGTPADLIGQNKILLRAQRGIKFNANGYHCVRVGRYTYYADATGHTVSKSEFIRNTKK